MNTPKCHLHSKHRTPLPRSSGRIGSFFSHKVSMLQKRVFDTLNACGPRLRFQLKIKQSSLIQAPNLVRDSLAERYSAFVTYRYFDVNSFEKMISEDGSDRQNVGLQLVVFD